MQYLIFHNPGLSLHLYLVANFTANKRLSDRRLVGNLPFQAVRLCRTDQFELHFLVKCLVVDLYRTTYVNLIKIYLILNYDFRIFQDAFQLFNTRLDIPLLILCSVILRIL